MSRMYTANQPLMLGGQIYMWDRYRQAKNLVHMMEAQFTKFGHQSRIELLNGNGQKQMFIVPLEDRNFRPLNDVYVQNPDRVSESLAKTLRTLYPAMKIKDIGFLEGMLGVFKSNARYSLGRLNVAVTDFIWQYLFGGLDGYATYISTKVLPVRSKDPSEWVAEMGAAINCTEYLGGGVAAQAYLQERHFADRGMIFRSQDYKMQPYPVKKDVHNSDAYVSIIDPILRLGKEKTLELIGGAQ
jgi:hypothetical protein